MYGNLQLDDSAELRMRVEELEQMNEELLLQLVRPNRRNHFCIIPNAMP